MHAVDETPVSPVKQAAPRHRFALRVSIEGDLRFLPHLDLLRMFARAAARARLSVSHSAGYNPHPHISLPLPRSVGIAATAEIVLLDLTDEPAPNALAAQINAVLPDGCRVTGAARVSRDQTPHPVAATYEVLLEPAERSPVAAALAAALAASHLEVERAGGPGRRSRRVDIRPLILELSLTDHAVRMRTRVGQEGTVRPAELLRLLGLDPNETLHRTRRVSVEWDMESLAAGW